MYYKFIFKIGGVSVSVIKAVDVLRLNFCNRNDERKELNLNKGDVVQIGRLRKNAQPNDIKNPFKFQDDLMSGEHCKITSEGDRFYIEDLQSKNGTWKKLYTKREKIRLDRCYRIGSAVKINIGFSQSKSEDLEKTIFKNFDEPKD